MMVLLLVKEWLFEEQLCNVVVGVIWGKVIVKNVDGGFEVIFCDEVVVLMVCGNEIIKVLVEFLLSEGEKLLLEKFNSVCEVYFGVCNCMMVVK